MTPTKEELEDYELRVKVHKKHIENYRFFLDRICNYLGWQGQRLGKNSWTPKEIRDWVTSEINTSESMDAPNKPGYYRANND